MDVKWSLRSVCSEIVHYITTSLFRLGRHKKHDIICSSVIISREHAIFLLKSDKLYVKDLGSSNGSFINGIRVPQKEAMLLHNGDIVSFGLSDHQSPCSPHGCFVYEVKCTSDINSTLEIISVLEDNSKESIPLNKEIEDGQSDLIITNTVENIAFTNNANENTSNAGIEMKWEDTESKTNLNKEVIKTEPKEQIENSHPVLYSVEDNVLVLDDDVEDVSELSSSQLFPINDPYLKIKQELCEFDHVDERPLVIVESDDSNDFDILDLLESNCTTNLLEVPSTSNENILSKVINLGTEIEFTKPTKDDILHTNKIINNKTHNTVLDKNCESNGIAVFTDNIETDSIATNKNSKNVENICSKTLLSESKNTNTKKTRIISGSSVSKYTKPPIIEPSVLTKPSTRKTSSSKENNNLGLKRKTLLTNESHKSKKQKVHDGTKNVESSASKPKRKLKNDVKNASTSKQEKLKIREERKRRLKNISTKSSTDTEEKELKISRKPSNAKPCVKVSKSRGEFMLINTPSSSNTKQTEVNCKSLSKILDSNQVTSATVNQSNLPPPKQSSSTSLNDPRNKSKNTFLTSESTKLAHSNTCFAANSIVTKPSISFDINNKNYVNKLRNEFHSKNSIDDENSIFNIPSFEAILNILNWRTTWLEEQKRISTHPPVNKRTAVKMCNSFDSHSDYCNVVAPLLMIELWNEVYEDWISIDTSAKQYQRKFRCIIGEVEKKSVYFILKCTAYITKQQRLYKQHVKEQTLVIVNVPIQQSSHTFQPLFGVIANCDRRLIRGNDFVDECLSKQLKPDIPESVLHFDILVKAFSRKINLNTIMEGAVLLSLVSSMREFNAIYSLNSSPLAKLILDPKVEDYAAISKSFKLNSSTMDKLNDTQEKAVLEATCLCLGDTPGIYLIQGPPGTGKTTVIKKIVQNIILYKNIKHIRLLLTAPSNSAVDGLAIKIIKELKEQLPDDEKKQVKLVRVGPQDSVNEEVKPYMVDKFIKNDLTKTFLSEHPEVKRDYNTLVVKRSALKNEIEKGIGKDVSILKEQLAAVENKYENFAKNYLKQEYQKAYSVARKRVIAGSNIICTTLSSCAWLKKLNENGPINCCIVDEATQSKESETLIPLMLGISKLILVGDPQQLPAVTVSQYAKELEHGQSLFARIKKNFDDNPTNPIQMLNVQYRMHPNISYFPNNAFYKGELKNSESCTYRQDICKIIPYFVFNLNLKYNQENIRNVNNEEIQCVEKLLGAINDIIVEKKEERQVSLGIITPYNTQKEVLLRKIGTHSFSSGISITINTVDSFQGLEKDIIIFSCVRYRPNLFLSDEQRLNVALTRAKYALYVIGTYSLFQNCPLLHRLKVDAEKRRLYYNIKTVSTNSLRRIIKTK